MKRYMKYMAALILAACTLPSCSTDDFMSGSMAEGEGAVALSARITISDGTVLEAPSEIKIYNGNNELVRRYSGNGLPGDIYLMAGDYKVVVTIGEDKDAAFDNKYYTGENTFTVVAGQSTAVAVTCKRHNVEAEVVFDQSVTDNFGGTAKAWVALASEDNIYLLGQGQLKELMYSESGKGYFKLPEGVTTLIYKFEGTHSDTSYGATGYISKSGKIEGIAAGANAKVGFKFSPDAPGYIEIFKAYVDKSTEEYTEDIIWTDITIEGAGVDLNAEQTYIPGTTAPVTYQVTTLTGTKRVRMRVDEVNYNIITDGAKAADCPAGVDVVITDNDAEVTFGTEFFAAVGGGDHLMRFTATDGAGGVLYQDTPFRVQGLLPVTEADYDLWNNTVTMKALVLDANANNTVALTVGTQTVNAVSKGNNIYAATFAPEWTQTPNTEEIKLINPPYPDYFVLTDGTGVFAGRTYATNGVINGVNYTGASFTTRSGDIIPGGDMENGSLSCFSNSNSGATMWGSGNNGTVQSLGGFSLCEQSTKSGMGGSHCAKLNSGTALGQMAAGNLFTGTFSMSGTTGTVGFGQKYTYTARPSGLKFKYHAKIGTVNENGHDGPLAKNSQDEGSIYVCIVDWSARHNVSSGTGDPTGFWNPAAQTEMPNCGKIIAYGQMAVKASTSGDAMVEGIIPLRYYDTACAAPTGNYTIIIACSNSTYGDFMNGCSSNEMYVDDFQWVY